MPDQSENWPSIERWDEELQREWRGKRIVPMLNELIRTAVRMKFGRELSQTEIRVALGYETLSAYSNNLNPREGCTLNFLRRVSDWLEIPVYLFAEVSELSKYYEEQYVDDPTKALKHFEHELRIHFYDKTANSDHNAVLNQRSFYEEPGSTVARLEVYRVDEDGILLPADRGGLRADAERFQPDYSFMDGDQFEILVHGKPGWNVLLIESELKPFQNLEWGLLNGALPGHENLILPCDRRTGTYVFSGVFQPPFAIYRITAAILNPNRDVGPWWRIGAGERCPDHLLDQLAEAAKADNKECILTTFTYSLRPRPTAIS